MNKPDQTINDYIQMIDNLERKLERATEALEFYAERAVINDNGYETDRYAKVARQALKEIKGE